MKFSAAFVAAAVTGLAAAQSACLSSAEAIPSCGQSCLTAAGSSYGCVYTDFACQCSHSSQINNAQLTSCVLSACSDAQTALMVSSAANALCSCASANAGSGGSGSSMATTSAAVPSTTAAMGGAGPTSAAAGGSGSSASMFTGGAAYAAGSIGGVMAGLLGLVAAL